MRASEALEVLRQFAQQYFAGANVVYANQSRAAKPELNLVTLRLNSVRRSLHPNNNPIGVEPVNCFQSKASVTVDLFTHGKPVKVGGATIAHANTAVEDMLWFVDHMDSEYGIRWLNKYDLTVLVEGDVQDVSGILNETTYEFRSRMNLALYFTEQAVGYSGMLLESSIRDDRIVPQYERTASGGGSDDLAALTADYFESVEITENKEETANE